MTASMREKILEVLKKKGYLSTKGVWYECQINPMVKPEEVRVVLDQMVEEKLIAKVSDNSIAYFHLHGQRKLVQVTISGLTGSGKTTVGVVIEKALREAGFDVQPFLATDGDEEFKKRHLDEGTLKEILPTIAVVIKENQLHRNFS